ncbi:MAG: sensor histidine kinase N-terminal domain-containing protein [Burkholderiales bacterium]|nr:MAG: sensor histidine kinase N-terminal domain-containing protein [Burkholderiales bacterium]
MTRRLRSLQARLVAFALALVAAIWLATAALTWRDVRSELDELLDSHLAQAAALLVAQQAGEIEHEDERRLDAPTLHRYAPKVAFQVFHEQRLVLRSANAPGTPMVPPGRGLGEGFTTVSIGGEDWRVFGTRGGERDVQVFVGEQVASRVAIVWAALRSALWPLAAAIPLLALGLWWSVRRGTAPLRALGRSVAERQPQALEPIAPGDAPAEVVPVIESLNGLFARIGEMVELERRFTADAAHELRTPIAAIRTQAQVALGETDDAKRRHALAATLAGCDRATRLVDQLLTLSRLESGAAPSTAPLDLAAVARRVVAEIAPRALDKRQTIELGAGQPVPLQGDEALVAALVRNLVDNAVRYSPAGARIEVSVEQESRGPRLRVEDNGPGMGEADIARLGERFFRVLGSAESGSGLGWSIVRRIARAQGATVGVIRSPTLGGLRIDVAWLAAAPPRRSV